MKVKCPACGAAMSLDALIGHDEARAALVAVSGISDELVRGCLKYLGLFRPLEKDLTFARVAKLVGELRPMMAAGQISRNRQDYPAPREAWLWAFEQVLVARDNGKLQRLPLTTHGFLLETLTFWAPAKSQAAAPVPFVPTDGGLQVNTKLRQGVAALAAWAGGDWLRQELAAGFAELAAMNLQGRPAAADMAVVAERWEKRLLEQQWAEEFDRSRFQTAFRALQSGSEWPNVNDFIRHLPPRLIPRAMLEKPKPDREKGRAEMAKVKEFLKQKGKQDG